MHVLRFGKRRSDLGNAIPEDLSFFFRAQPLFRQKFSRFQSEDFCFFIFKVYLFFREKSLRFRSEDLFLYDFFYLR